MSCKGYFSWPWELLEELGYDIPCTGSSKLIMIIVPFFCSGLFHTLLSVATMYCARSCVIWLGSFQEAYDHTLHVISWILHKISCDPSNTWKNQEEKAPGDVLWCPSEFAMAYNFGTTPYTVLNQIIDLYKLALRVPPSPRLLGRENFPITYQYC